MDILAYGEKNLANIQEENDKKLLGSLALCVCVCVCVCVCEREREREREREIEESLKTF